MATAVVALVPVGFAQRLIAVAAGIMLGFGMLHTASQIPSGFWNSRIARRPVATPRPGGELVRLLTTVAVVVGSVLIARFAVAPGEFNQRAISLVTGIALGFGVLKLASRAPSGTRLIIEDSPPDSPVVQPTASTSTMPPPPPPPPPPSADPEAPPDRSFPGSLQR
jgi:hypothetical protein